ncbi:hypothetical protein WN943_012129 [Citrus x changshan-huyou]
MLAYRIKLVRVPETVTVFQVRKTLEQNATEIVSMPMNKNVISCICVVELPTDLTRSIVEQLTSLADGIGNSEWCLLTN